MIPSIINSYRHHAGVWPETAPHQEPQNPEPAMGSKEAANPEPTRGSKENPNTKEKKKPDTDTEDLVTPKKLNQINESGEPISDDSSSSNSDDSNEDEEGEEEDEVENQALGIRANYV